MLAMGICDSGSSLGAVLARPVVAWITLTWGWRAAFVATGMLGIVWTAAFLLFRHKHPEMAIAENAPKDLEWHQDIDASAPGVDVLGYSRDVDNPGSSLKSGKFSVERKRCTSG